MQRFNNVYSSCILIQIEVYQAGKRKLKGEKKRHSSTHIVWVYQGKAGLLFSRYGHV